MKKISDIIAEEKPQKINKTRTQTQQLPPDIKDIDLTIRMYELEPMKKNALQRNPKNIKLYKLELDGESPIVAEEVSGELTIRLSDEAKRVLEKYDFKYHRLNDYPLEKVALDRANDLNVALFKKIDAKTHGKFESKMYSDLQKILGDHRALRFYIMNQKTKYDFFQREPKDLLGLKRKEIPYTMAAPNGSNHTVIDFPYSIPESEQLNAIIDFEKNNNDKDLYTKIAALCGQKNERNIELYHHVCAAANGKFPLNTHFYESLRRAIKEDLNNLVKIEHDSKSNIMCINMNFKINNMSFQKEEQYSYVEKGSVGFKQGWHKDVCRSLAKNNDQIVSDLEEICNSSADEYEVEQKCLEYFAKMEPINRYSKDVQKICFAVDKEIQERINMRDEEIARLTIDDQHRTECIEMEEQDGIEPDIW